MRCMHHALRHDLHFSEVVADINTHSWTPNKKNTTFESCPMERGNVFVQIFSFHVNVWSGTRNTTFESCPTIVEVVLILAESCFIPLVMLNLSTLTILQVNLPFLDWFIINCLCLLPPPPPSRKWHCNVIFYAFACLALNLYPLIWLS